jgi:hypothetical protein
LLRNSRDLRFLGNMKVAAFGSGTASALISRAIRPDIEFPASQRALSIRDLSDGKNSRPYILVTLSNEIAIEPKEWAEIIQLKLFRSNAASWEPHWVQEITNNPPDFILFNNPAAVEGFMRVLGQDTVRSLMPICKFVSTTGVTAAEARRHDLPISPDAIDLFQK